MGIRTSLVQGRAELLDLGRQAATSGLLAQRLEHEPAWLAEDIHGLAARGGAIAAHDGDRLVGFLPFLHRPSHRLAVKLGEIKLFSLPFGILQLFGVVVVAERVEVVEILLAGLEDAGLPHDALSIEETPVDCPGWIALSDLARSRYVTAPRGSSTHVLVRLPATYDEYLGKFSSKSRYNMRRRTRLLAEAAGTLQLRVFHRKEDVLPALESIEELVKKTYHYRLLGKDITKANAQLVREFEFLASQGWLRGYVLYGGTKPIAYSIGYLVRDTYQYEMPGYDPAFAEHSPGNELLALLIEDLMAHHLAKVVDFGAGDAQYKQFFGNACHGEISAWLARKRPWPLVALGIERLFYRTTRALVWILDRLNMRARVKKAIRRSA